MNRPDLVDPVIARPRSGFAAIAWMFALALSIGLLSVSGASCLGVLGDPSSRQALAADLEFEPAAVAAPESAGSMRSGEASPNAGACPRERGLAEPLTAALDPAEQQPSVDEAPLALLQRLRAALPPPEPAHAGPDLPTLLRPPRA